ncbi:YqgE/AlgH family protein [Niabella terrae]
MIDPVSGSLLVANPHLSDPHFLRSVIFLCEHSEEGSFGFVLNRKLDYSVGQLVTELEDFNLPVYEGGPVEQNTLHFLHQYPEKIPGGREVLEGVFWGGAFEDLIHLIVTGMADVGKIRFFQGYSGWGPDQLGEEMEEKAWIVAKALPGYLFAADEKQLWREVLKALGGDYNLILNAPLDPRMN